jgi:hypothetical protein
MITEEILRGLGFLPRPVREREVARLLNEETREREAARLVNEETVTEFFEAFQAQLIERKVLLGPCLEQKNTISERHDYTQLHIPLEKAKNDAVHLANAVADHANGKLVSFARLVVPRGVAASNRIDQDQISIRFVAANDIRADETIARADVLFTIG